LMTVEGRMGHSALEQTLGDSEQRLSSHAYPQTLP
jgi:hypothetical protein